MKGSIAKLDPATPMTVNYIFGVCAIPADFARVDAVEPSATGVQFRSGNVTVDTGLYLDWLKETQP
ncbi:hypothetical protein ACERK3_01655 [Phycisphaerales bacterium AB-hyl4]|uniref:Halobacterial output domain-containing protein n=1 Tax=Natronomicrosphaera hydrolytica TaxID=3242702 RepID=A0ABV4U069_9BACT